MPVEQRLKGVPITGWEVLNLEQDNKDNLNKGGLPPKVTKRRVLIELDFAFRTNFKNSIRIPGGMGGEYLQILFYFGSLPIYTSKEKSSQKLM